MFKSVSVFFELSLKIPNLFYYPQNKAKTGRKDCGWNFSSSSSVYQPLDVWTADVKEHLLISVFKWWQLSRADVSAGLQDIKFTVKSSVKPQKRPKLTLVPNVGVWWRLLNLTRA